MFLATCKVSLAPRPGTHETLSTSTVLRQAGPEAGCGKLGGKSGLRASTAGSNMEALLKIKKLTTRCSSAIGQVAATGDGTLFRNILAALLSFAPLQPLLKKDRYLVRNAALLTGDGKLPDSWQVADELTPLTTALTSPSHRGELHLLNPRTYKLQPLPPAQILGCAKCFPGAVMFPRRWIMNDRHHWRIATSRHENGNLFGIICSPSSLEPGETSSF
ncbi:hypothetical protein NEUTE2DRAFT_49195 [Neurospora tetrasperma FGSC 2509]|nr:hypothetical protein NEUTE2DRAFT_49195 [Neurospora tetrasperma FGSC 2509]